VFVSITGLNYGTSSWSRSAWAGSTLMVAARWISDSALVVKTPAFSDKNVPVAAVRFNGSSTNQSVLFTDNPRINAVVPSVYSIRGGKIVTLIGTNFGLFNQNNQSSDATSLNVKFAGNSAYNSSWISDSSVASMVPPGIIFNGSTISVEISTFQKRGISYGLTAYTSINVSSITPGLFTVQSFGNASFSVNLFFRPTANVTVAISSLVPTRARIMTPTLVFTPSSFAIPQTAVIQGVPNVIQEGDTFYNVTLSVSSDDSDYDGLFGRVFEFVLTGDIDVAGVIFWPNFVVVQEPNSSFVFNVTLRSQPLQNMSFGLIVGDTNAAFLSPTFLTFSPLEWNVPQQVTVRAINDFIMQGIRSFNVSAVNITSTDPFYSNLQDRYPQNSLIISVQDNDVAGAEYTRVVESVRKDDQVVQTPRQPSKLYVNITSQPVADVNASVLVLDSEAGIVIGSQYYIFQPQNWTSTALFQIYGVYNEVKDGDKNFSIAITFYSSDPNYNNRVVIANCTMIDTNIATFNHDKYELQISEPNVTSKFTIWPQSAPTRDLNLSFFLVGIDAAKLRVTPSILYFTPSNWRTRRTVVVSPIDNFVVDGTINSTIYESLATTDPNYAAADVVMKNVSVVILDDDSSDVLVTQANGSTAEQGGNSTFMIRLQSQPVADVLITATSMRPLEGIVSPESSQLTFNSSNWNAWARVVVVGVDDSFVDGAQAYNISVVCASADPQYNNRHSKLVSSLTLMTTDRELHFLNLLSL